VFNVCVEILFEQLSQERERDNEREKEREPQHHPVLHEKRIFFSTKKKTFFVVVAYSPSPIRMISGREVV
jgi:hypothetical protein